MPILRSKLSTGQVGQGRITGGCARFFFPLDDMADTVRSMYVPILRVSEGMSANNNDNSANDMEVNLVTSWVWVPVATALMADPSIKIQQEHHHV